MWLQIQYHLLTLFALAAQLNRDEGQLIGHLSGVARKASLELAKVSAARWSRPGERSKQNDWKLMTFELKMSVCRSCLAANQFALS